MQSNETAERQAEGPAASAGNRMAAGFGEERRASPRSPVIRSAQLVFDQSNVVYDCLVLDESAGGVMIDLGAMIKVPEDVTIRFNSGGAFPAQRRWASGTRAGFKFTGAQIISQETALRMKKAADILEIQGLGPAMQMLRTVRFLDNEELRRAAEDAESAMLRLQAVLTGRVS
jgi:hypothetical protein